jgi:hypothetical protein
MDKLDPLTDWCVQWGLQRITANLSDVCGILEVSELANLGEEEIKEITENCQMNVGERTRFKKAIQILKDGSKKSLQIIQAVSTPAHAPVPPNWEYQDPLLCSVYLSHSLTEAMQKLVDKTTNPAELGRGKDVWKLWYPGIPQDPTR